ncbi:hypothetical protein EMIT0232MI5_60168 [Pseudomonas sp. IT-232MI5]
MALSKSIALVWEGDFIWREPLAVSLSYRLGESGYGLRVILIHQSRRTFGVSLVCRMTISQLSKSASPHCLHVACFEEN